MFILTTTTIVSIRTIAVVGAFSFLFFATWAILFMFMFLLFLLLFAGTVPILIPIVALFVSVLSFLVVFFVLGGDWMFQVTGVLHGICGDGWGFVFFFFFVDGLLYELKANPEGVDFCSEPEEALVDFSFEVHLYPLLGVVDSLDSPAHFTNLYEQKHTF